MDALLNDLRYALRTFSRSPGFAALTILCLALGIGVNTTIFSVVDAIAIRPLPFTDPDTLVALHTTRRANGVDSGSVSYLDLQEWKAGTHTVAEMGSVAGRSLTIADQGEEPERFLGATVSANLFPMLGIQPILGRSFRPDEDAVGAPHVVLLSHGVWQRRYAGTPSIVGRTITVNGDPHTVIGVMPPRFQFPERAQLWIPQDPIEHDRTRTDRDVVVFGRLKRGVSFEQARLDMVAIGHRLAREHREDQGWGATAKTMRDDLTDADAQRIVFTMMGAVTIVLLIACANVANLLLARATVRQREISVRSALGAGRARIVRQLLTESVLIALASAPLGVLVADVGLQWLTAAIPPQSQVPYYMDWSMSPRIVAYTAVIAALTGIVFGLAPAFQAARANLQESLKDGGRGAGGSARRNRLRSILVVAEVALSLVLLVGASLFVRSFLNMQAARAGIDTSPLMQMRFYMPGDAYAKDDAMTRRTEDIVRRVEGLPGVVAAYGSNMVPFDGGGSGSPVVCEGRAFAAGEEPNTLMFGVTPHVFKTLGLPIVAGRDFTETDEGGRTPVAIVNGVLARRLWPNRSDVVGQRLRLLSEKDGDWITVVGLVNDFRLFTVQDGKPSPYVFVSYPHGTSRNTGLTIRAAGGAPASLTAAVRQAIRQSDPALPIFNVQTGEDARVNSFWEFRLFGWMFSIFGAIALVLASIGVYGVLSYTVSQRTQEIGVRMALGASRGRVFGLVVSDGVQLAAIGIVCGVVGAAGVTRVVKTFLYNVSANDPLSFIGTSVFLAVIALLASYVPALRATAVDPMVALRSE